MSLIHWWPLNGDLLDRGSNPKHGTIIGNANVTTSGILGKCLSGMSGSQTTAGVSVSNCNLLDEISNEYSAAIWIKVHGTHVHYEGAFISSGDWNNKRWTFGINQANNRIQPLTNASNQNYISLGKTLTNDKWYHVATVYKDGKVSLYLDGVLINTITATAPYQSSATNLTIGRETYASGYFSFNGDICDVRIYDHALSQTEVKELSKALIVHYTFDDVLAEPTTNLVTSLTKGGNTSLDSTRKTIITNGVDSDTYFYLNLSKTLVEGKTYTISCSAEGIISNNGNTGECFRFGLQGQGGVPQMTIYNGYNSFTFVATSKQAVSSLLFDDIWNYRSLSTCKFYNWQLEEKDHATPYTPSTRTSMIIDESGYDHPTVLVNDCKLVADTNSGTFALRTAGAGDTASFSACSYLRADMKTSITPTAFTVSMWSKVNTWGKQTSGILSLNTSTDPTGYLTSTFVQYDSNFRLNNSASSAQSSISSKIVTLGEWHYYAFTWDGANLKGYKDGALYNTVPAAFIPDPFRYVFLGVDRAGGAVRDADVTWGNFKIYMTALSAEDIEVESKARALITDKGDIEAHQFIEDCETIQVTNTYNVEAQDIQEIGNDEYEPLEYIASTGTQYIDTGVYWTSEKATIVADLMVTAWKASSTIFGSEERYSGSNRYFAHILHAGSANGNYATYIGTGSIGTAILTKDTRSLIEYAAHGDKKVTVGVTVNGKKTIYVNNKAYSGTILTHQNSTQSAANKGHIYIFSNHNAYNGTGGIQNMSAMRLYRFTMIQDDKYIRDFIPCRRKTDSKVGLFDMVTGQFYTSPVGNFIAGNAITNEEITAKFLSGGSIQARQFIEL